MEHNEALAQAQAQIDQAAALLWGLSKAGLHEIQRSLAELRIAG